jgi:hypothetical protein
VVFGGNMEQVIIRHLSGSRAKQTDQFFIRNFKELSFGRDPSSTIKYDPNKDDLVSTRHAKIEQSTQDPTQFTSLGRESPHFKQSCFLGLLSGG